MKTTARNLAMRDPAFAAAIGAIGSGDFGADFGAEFGDDLGYEFGADAPAATAMVPAPTREQALSAWAQIHQQKAITDRRARMLEPNKGSHVKVETYVMAMSQALTLGTTVALDMSQNPDVNFRPQRVVSNAPAPGFATISNIKLANVSAVVGGTTDAWIFSATAVGTRLDLPTLSPANRASCTGSYSGFVPPGYVAGSAYSFSLSFVGPATMAA